MGSAIRSRPSACTAKAVPFIVQAEDEIVNLWSELRRDEVGRSVGDQLLRHPTMNTTGATGECGGIDCCPLEPKSHRRCAFPAHGAAEPVASVVAFRRQPLCLPQAR